MKFKELTLAFTFLVSMPHAAAATGFADVGDIDSISFDAPAYDVGTLSNAIGTDLDAGDLAGLEPAGGKKGWWYGYELEALNNPLNLSESDGTLVNALFGGNFDVEFRYRYQFIDDEGFADNGHSSTFRTLVKYQTKPLHGVSVLGEVRSVERIGTGNLHDELPPLQGTRPIIPDPDSLEVDQAYVKFDRIIPDTAITVGRRKIALNNQRFISTLPFRQNANSFDGVVVENWSLPDTYLHYSYALNFNRAFTNDSPIGNFDEANIHLLHGEHTVNDHLKLIGYAYLLDIEEESFAGAGNSATNTFGVNAKGQYPLDKLLGETAKPVAFHYDLEFAHQVDTGDNPNDFDVSYYRIQPGVSYGPWRLNLGYEVLEGDGTVGFSTPLALLHAFNGYADVFVGTPAIGLEDAYVNLSYHLKESGVKIGDYDLFGNTKFHIAYHDFSAEDNGTDFGTEFDASIKKKLNRHATLVVEYAHYDADFNGAVTPASPSFQRDRDQVFTALVVKF